MPVPVVNAKIVTDIIRSWRAPSSNYILVSPPLGWGEEVLSLLCSTEIHTSENYKPGELAIAYFRAGEIKDALGFAEAVSKKWKVNLSALGGERDSTEILSYAVNELGRKMQKAIIIIGGFHQAIEKLSWDVGATLRNLEHAFGLRTVVEMPIKLSSIRSRWELFKAEVPFLASDFGQGHSIRTIGAYEEREITSVLDAFGVDGRISTEVFDLSGGIPVLVHWLARQTAECNGNLVIDETSFAVAEQFKRMLKWLDAPEKRLWLDLLSIYPDKDEKGLTFAAHEWFSYLVDSNTRRIRSSLLIKNLTSERERRGYERFLGAAAEGNQSLTVAFLATAWGPKFGGINSFNLECCQNLANLPGGKINVICIVPTRRSIVEPSNNVDVISLRDHGREEFDESDTPLLVERLRRFGRLVIVGHDVKTGPLSNSLGSLLRAQKKIVFCHMAYDSYYSLVATSADSKAKYDQQCKTFIGADIVFGVGPKLTNYVHDCLRSMNEQVDVFEYVPRLLGEAPVRRFRRTPKVTFIGRIEPARDIIKQSKMALLAIAKAIRSTKIEVRDISVQFVGARPGSHDEETTRSELNRLAERPVACNYVDYVDNRTLALTAIRDSSLVVMPSFHEGFGLVAWEAISLGIPVIISDNSGLYEHLKNTGLVDLIGSFHVSGNEATEDGGDTAVFCELIRERLLNPERFHREAAELRSRLERALGELSSNTFYREVEILKTSQDQRVSIDY